MDWFETLPQQCPPFEATASDGVSFFRLLLSNPATEQDFLSQRALFKTKPFKVSECQARSISIFSNIHDCIKVSKLPTFRGKDTYLGEFVLSLNDGVILNTPSHSSNSHFSWWRTKDFDFLKVKVISNE